MLFRDEDNALEIVRVALACEPPVGEEGITIANALINSASIVIGIEDRDERAKLTEAGYRLARAMLGNETADMLRFPKYPTFGLLPLLRAKRRLQELMQRQRLLRPKNLRASNFGALLEVTVLDDSSGEFSYRLSDHYVADLSSKW